MAEDITLEEKARRLDATLDKLQRTMETGGGGLNETVDEFLAAAQEYRTDSNYRALLGPVGAVGLQGTSWLQNTNATRL